VVCLSSLAYRSYDANFGVHHAAAEEATDVLLAPKGRSSPFAPAYRQLVAWAERYASPPVIVIAVFVLRSSSDAVG
jgi:hypothetical protein